jgi:hypothetical protein
MVLGNLKQLVEKPAAWMRPRRPSSAGEEVGLPAHGYDGGAPSRRLECWGRVGCGGFAAGIGRAERDQRGGDEEEAARDERVAEA